MATPPPFTDTPTSLAVDTSYLARTQALRFSQIAALLVPPLYSATLLYRQHPFTFNRFLRATWIGTAAGAMIGGGFELARLQGMTPVAVGEKAWRVGHDAYRIRSTDYSTIGAVLGSLLTSAIIWKRARKVHLVLGGAALGEAAGYAAYMYQAWSAGRPVVPPEVKQAEQKASEIAEKTEQVVTANAELAKTKAEEVIGK